jgi:flagella basal body P-ring formation protein FlgA
MPMPCLTVKPSADAFCARWLSSARFARAGMAGVLVLLLAGPAMAQAGGVAAGAAVAAPTHDVTSELSAISERWVNDTLQTQGGAAALPLRMEVQVGQLDPRLKLAACSKVEPYLPTGARLWGRSRLGLRCLQGQVPWNVFLPLTVKAYGPAWVLQRPVAAGAVLAEDDAVQAEVDWAEDPAAVYANAKDWVGLVAARPLASGQTLRQNVLRTPNLFVTGAQVRVLVTGGGFTVVGTGRAMSPGGAGQTVRVRMDNGKLISGVVNPEGDVVAQ